MTGIVSDTTKSAKQIAQQMAKQMAREPLEIWKEGAEQIKGQETEEAQELSPEIKRTQVSPEEKAKIEAQGQRQIQALEGEIADIEKQKIFNDLLRKIAAGEEVSLADIPELSREQIEVLKAQQLAVSARKEVKAESQPLEEPKTKRSRRFPGFGQKAQAEKQQTRVEKPLPPSG
jgi:hypothetical protein